MAIVGSRSKSIIPTGMTVRGKIEWSEKPTVAGTVDGEIHLLGTI
jgi:cytoskeletal protein CcmA (bactofilin family)